MLTVEVLRTTRDGQRLAGTIDWDSETGFAVHPTQENDYSLLLNIVEEPIYIFDGFIQPDDGERFMRNLYKQYSGSYVRVGKVEER